MKCVRFVLVAALLSLLLLPCTGSAQQAQPAPVALGKPMPDFTLPVYQGGDLTFSSLRGKTVMLVFPRGLASKGSWCHVCNYQYAELAEAEQKQQFRKQHSVEILVVFPYTRSMIDEWIEKYPAQLADIENGKNPSKDQPLDDRAKRRLETYRREFPKNFQAKKGEVPTPFPILIDSERTLSRGLGIFTEEWSGSKVEQNIPSIYIVDSKGIVQFKYISQNTFDRPGLSYLSRMIRWIGGLPSR